MFEDVLVFFSPRCLSPTMEPLRDVFEGMESHIVQVVPACALGTVTIQQKAVFLDGLSIDQVHALLDETVFARIIGMQFRVTLCFSLVVDIQRLVREDLNGSQHSNVLWTIFHIHWLLGMARYFGVKVCPQSVGEEDTIRVNFHNPVKTTVPSIRDDHIPSPEEVLRV